MPPRLVIASASQPVATPRTSVAQTVWPSSERAPVSINGCRATAVRAGTDASMSMVQLKLEPTMMIGASAGSRASTCASTSRAAPSGTATQTMKPGASSCAATWASVPEATGVAP